MKYIISYKINLSTFTFKKTLELYQLCQTVSSNVYLVANEQTCEVKDLPRLISFLLALNDKDVLIVIEGKEAPSDRKHINHFLNNKKKRFPA
jgi:phosphotransferase system HPr-like phosphotransfer protein